MNGWLTMKLWHVGDSRLTFSWLGSLHGWSTVGALRGDTESYNVHTMQRFYTDE